jgi:ABC-2 type transport system ATP-binding protein
MPALDPDTRRISAPARDRPAALTAVVRELDGSGIAAEDLAIRRPTLDDVFLHLTGQEAARAERRGVKA